LFPVRLHHITALDTLDRKRLEENFLFWAEQINVLSDYSISRKTITRDRVKANAVEDIWWNRREHESSSGMELVQNPLIGDSNVTIRAGVASEYIVDWKVELKPTTADCYNVRVIPYAAGQILWEGADILQREFPLDPNSAVRPVPDGTAWARDPAGVAGTPLAQAWISTVCGRAYFSALTSNFTVGLIAAKETSYGTWDDAEFRAKRVQLVVRRPH